MIGKFVLIRTINAGVHFGTLEEKYQYIQQQVFDPLTKRIESAKD